MIVAGSFAEMCLIPIVVLGWISLGTLWVAMWYFWFSFHQTSTLKKLLWFLTLQLAPLGTLIYFFGAYYRSHDFHQRQPERPAGNFEVADSKIFAERLGSEF